MNASSFLEKENACKLLYESAVRGGLRFYHVCTPGTNQFIIFENSEHYAMGMTAAATSAHDAGVTIITFELMSNHVHFILRCKSLDQALTFFSLFKRRLSRMLSGAENIRDLSHFDCGDPIVIDSLESLRNHILYTNRNNYVVDPSQTPFSYPYGANPYYFNPWAKAEQGIMLGSLSNRAKIRVLRTKNTAYPDAFLVTQYGISPSSFCDIKFGEKVFRDARHYFNKLSKDIESYKELSEMLQDLAFYTDDELVGIVYAMSFNMFGQKKPALLTAEQKTIMAKELRYGYNSDIRKISRLLHIPEQTLAELFPAAKTPAK